MQLEYRQAQPRDLEVVQQITEKAYSVWIPVLGYEPRPLREDHGPRVERGEVLLAYDQEAIKGLIVIEHDDFADLIFSVAVDPNYKGRGIGQQMIKEVERRGKANGKSSIKLYTNALMGANIALYLKLGYAETSKGPGFQPGSILVHMAKEL